MNTTRPNSLAATLDAVNEAFFYGRRLSKSQREDAAEWIAGRQGKPGAYAGMFAPTAVDMKDSLVLFTGERVVTGGGARHILGEEACRALILLDVRQAAVRDALEQASRGMMGRLVKAREGEHGIYCCGRCSVALWRHLAVGGLAEADPERWLRVGIGLLKSHRDGRGRWRRFPYYYTLLALSEIALPTATAEMRYAAPSCERYLKRRAARGKHAQRRRDLSELILAKC
jgi:hypothetical protein